MMSPGPPPQPIYPRNALPPSSTMAESPRPIHTTAFPLHQLPPPPAIPFGNPPVTTPRYSSGLVLAPLAIPSPPGSSSGSTLPRQQQQQQSVSVSVRQRQPNHLSQQPHISSQQSPTPISIPHQQPSLQPRSDGRNTTAYSRLLPSQSTFSPPTAATFSPPSPYDSGSDLRFDPRFSRETDDRRRYAAYGLGGRCARD